MNIILEGPDNGGKSTLALALRDATGMPIKDKEGRPKTWHLLLEKLRKYEAVDGMIIDRHPIITQSVYGFLRNDPEIPDEFMDTFFKRQDLIIYCRALRTDPLDTHEPSPTDDEAHLKMVEEQYGTVLRVYDSWAVQSANITYRQYDQTPMIIAMVKGILHERG